MTESTTVLLEGEDKAFCDRLLDEYHATFHYLNTIKDHNFFQFMKLMEKVDTGAGPLAFEKYANAAYTYNNITNALPTLHTSFVEEIEKYFKGRYSLEFEPIKKLISLEDTFFPSYDLIIDNIKDQVGDFTKRQDNSNPLRKVS